MNIKPSLTDNHHWVTFIKSLCFLFITTSISAFPIYFGVSLITNNPYIKSPVFITDGYHSSSLQAITEHPFPFLLSISFFLSFLGALWIVIVAPKFKRLHVLQLLALPWIAVIVTSPIWGMIWSIYRWPPQSFSDNSTMMLFYRYDAVFGLNSGILSAVISFPINIISYTTVCTLLFISRRLFLEKPKSLN